MYPSRRVSCCSNGNAESGDLIAAFLQNVDFTYTWNAIEGDNEPRLLSYFSMANWTLLRMSI